MDLGAILPQNLIIIGPADGPEPLRDLDDPRIVSYVRHYDALVERGVTLISQSDLEIGGPESLKKALTALPCQNLYLSIDVDISALQGVLAARFIDQTGCDTDLVLQAAALIADQVHSGKFRLVGLDIMEMDVHKIGARLKSGDEDGTSDFLRDYISLFLKSLPAN
jgi:arginase family enzyme